MNKKCLGCGSIIQIDDVLKEGYSKNINSDFCERCFRIKNYGDYKKIDKNNNEFIEILKKINETNDLVLLVIDLFSISYKINEITKYLNNDILLVYTKRDVLPLSVSDEKLLNYKTNLKTIDEVVVSSNKNYNMDLLFEKINRYKKGKNVYVVGYTNAGKSTLINKLIYNYSDLTSDITTSILPSTTLDTIEIKLNDELTLIDTPGILDEGNIFNYLDGKELKQIIPNREIKPISYQIKKTQYLMIDKYAYIEASDVNLVLFFSNALKVERFYKNKEVNLVKKEIEVKQGEDVVISGLGFIKVMNDTKLKIYTLDKVDVYTRTSLI